VPRIRLIEATPSLGWFVLFRSSSSPAGVRFLASVTEGRGLNPSARPAGIDKDIGYRWLRENYLLLRRQGKSAIEYGSDVCARSCHVRATNSALSSGVSRTLFRTEIGVSDERISLFELRLAVDRRALYLLVRRALSDSVRCRAGASLKAVCLGRATRRRRDASGAEKCRSEAARRIWTVTVSRVVWTRFPLKSCRCGTEASAVSRVNELKKCFCSDRGVGG
jgi:hypothetical protein